MSHATIFKCDHCQREWPSNKPNLPSGWEVICGADLCDVCSRELHRWLGGAGSFVFVSTEPPPDRATSAPGGASRNDK